MHILGGPCGTKKKTPNKNPCWQRGAASRERQTPYGGIGKMGPGLSSGDGARSIVSRSGMVFLCGTRETIEGTLLLNESRKIRKFERTWEQS
jgi:hypothetical protein